MKTPKEFVKEFEEKLPKMLKERYEEDAAYFRNFKDPDDPSFVPINNVEALKKWQKQKVESFKKLMNSDLGKWLKLRN